ncbi:MAG: universal stress protein [Pseudomonadales bacterium]
MRVILVPVANRPECVHALNTSFWLARRLGASVIGCHIRPHADSDTLLPNELGDDGHEVWRRVYQSKYTTGATESAETVFSEMARSFDFPIRSKPSLSPAAYWEEKLGTPEKVIAINGPLADLSIVSRPRRLGGSIARTFMHAAIDNKSRPVLVLPQRKVPSVGKRITIAWNQSEEASRAVFAALPLLRRADSVSIISCGSESQLGPKSGQLRTYLKHWGVKADIQKDKKDNACEARILKVYEETDSDLLVMGAYSRSRIRETIFGGVTEHMLNKASKTSLFIHA